MTSRIIVCMNDFPHGVMPKGSTEADAEKLCKHLKEEWMLKHPYMSSHKVFFHYHEVPFLRRAK